MIPKTSWVIKLRNQVMQSSLVCHKRRLSITPSACCQARRPATNAIATSPACWRLRHDVRQPPAGRPGGVAVFTVLDGSVLAQFQSWFLKLSDSLDELLHRNSSGTSQPQEMAVARKVLPSNPSGDPQWQPQAPVHQLDVATPEGLTMPWKLFTRQQPVPGLCRGSKRACCVPRADALVALF